MPASSSSLPDFATSTAWLVLTIRSMTATNATLLPAICSATLLVRPPASLVTETLPTLEYASYAISFVSFATKLAITAAPVTKHPLVGPTSLIIRPLGTRSVSTHALMDTSPTQHREHVSYATVTVLSVTSTRRTVTHASLASVGTIINV